MSKMTDKSISDIADSEECNPDDRGWGPKFSALKFARAIEAAAAEPLLQRIAELERQLEEARKDALEAFDSAVESASLLGGTQCKKGFGSYTEDDARFELSMNQAIAKHRAAMQKGKP